MNLPENVKLCKMKLLPPPPDHCRICAAKHEPHQPHNANSLFYATRFQMRYGRPGTWADAIAHMRADDQAKVRRSLECYGERWTEPPAGVAPIPEPIDG